MDAITIIAVGLAVLCISATVLIEIGAAWGYKGAKFLVAGWIVGFLAGFIMKTIT